VQRSRISFNASCRVCADERPRPIVLGSVDDNEAGPAKETKHRGGICARNFSCNRINGTRRTGSFIRTAAESPALASAQDSPLLNGLTAIAMLVYGRPARLCTGCTSHCANAPFGFPATGALARARCVLWTVARYTGCSDIVGCTPARGFHGRFGADLSSGASDY